MDETKPDRLIPVAEILQTLGISRSTLWRMTDRGEWPRPVVISRRRVGYPASEVANKMQRMIADRDLRG